MRDDWKEPQSPTKGPAETREEPRAEPREPDDFEALLADYERRKQDEAGRLVQRALELENARRKGSDLLSHHVLQHARDVAGRLRKAGHRVLNQESLDAYPPNVRLHLYPKVGPMDLAEPRRWTMELTWGDPDPDRLVAQLWTSAGLGEMIELGSALADEVDQLWVREQFLAFVRQALDLT